jgi:hypothetical protein
MNQLSINIYPAPSVQPVYESLDYTSKRGIYKIEGDAEYPYYVFLGNSTYHVAQRNNLHHSQNMEGLNKGGFKYTFITDEYSVKDNKISFEIPQSKPLNLKDNPPSPGTMIQVNISGDYNTDIFIVPNFKTDHPAVVRGNRIVYSVCTFEEWMSAAYEYRIVGKNSN